MIHFRTGNPGSGKSYGIAYDILHGWGDKYFIFHNVDGLPESETLRDWREYIKDQGLDFFQFFSEEHQTVLADQVTEKYGLPILIIIDEAVRYLKKFHDGFAAWIAFHRHLNQEIVIVTQNMPQIHRDYAMLAEYEIRAKNNFLFNVPYFFLYQKTAGGESCGYLFKRKKKEVFDFYKSALIKGGGRKKTSLTMPFAIALLIGLGLYFFRSPDVHSLTDSVQPGRRPLASSASVSPGASADPRGVSSIPIFAKAVYGLSGSEQVLVKQGDKVFPLGVLMTYRVVHTSPFMLKVYDLERRKIVTFYYDIAPAPEPERGSEGEGAGLFASKGEEGV